MSLKQNDIVLEHMRYAKEVSEGCAVCKAGFDDEGEELHWWRCGDSQCPIVRSKQLRDEDDDARNEYYR